MTTTQAAVGAAADRVGQLEQLLHRVRAAVDGVPPLQRPAAVVGAPGAWTGTTARRLHAEQLSPLTVHLREGLRGAVEAVEAELRQAHGALRSAQAADAAAVALEQQRAQDPQAAR